MANYAGFTRSNYFRVTDPEAFKKVMDAVLTDEDSLELWERTENGMTYYAFGAYSSICGLRSEDEDDDGDEFEAEAVYEALTEVVAPDDAIIITEIGYEKLRYLTAYAVVITRTEVEWVDLRSNALETARRLLRNPEFNPCMEY